MLQIMAGHDFNPNIALVLIEEILKLSKIIEHEGILAELHFDQQLALDEIDLLERSWDGYALPGIVMV